jgi:hypothetical protein
VIHQGAQWLETTPVGLMVRESLYGFPIIVGIHLLALTLSAGLVVWFDLRLLGLVLTDRPVSVVYRRLIPWTATGFAVSFLSGGMLLTGYATDAYVNRAFHLKLIALAVAGLNAAFYHRVTERRRESWDSAARAPHAARTAGLISIAAWATVVCAGRFMSYTMF